MSSASRALLGAALGLLAGGPLPAYAQDGDEAPASPGLDPQTAGPFLWLEALRHDERPRSPITERTTLVSLPAPISSGPRHGVTLLSTYRRDVLRPAALARVGTLATTLHVLELGLPVTFRAASRWALEVDARLAYASAFAGHGSDAWVPGVRAGATWVPGSEALALSLSVLYSPTVLDGVTPVPLFGLYYRPQDRPLRVDMLLPRYAEFAWLLGKTQRGELYGAFHWEGIAWNVPLNGEGGARLTRQEVRLDVGTRMRLLGPIGLELGIHWVPRQSLSLGSARAQERLQSDLSFTAALVLDKVLAGQVASAEERP